MSVIQTKEKRKIKLGACNQLLVVAEQLRGNLHTELGKITALQEYESTRPTFLLSQADSKVSRVVCNDD